MHCQCLNVEIKKKYSTKTSIKFTLRDSSYSNFITTKPLKDLKIPVVFVLGLTELYFKSLKTIATGKLDFDNIIEKCCPTGKRE